MDHFRLLFVLALVPALARAQAPSPRVLERQLLEELIEINTSDSAGRTRDAADAMARHLIAAGIPSADVRVLGPDAKYQSLVARYRGRNPTRKPILLMAHLDVVDARKEDWTFDPYEFRELDGYYYGRGSSDNKAGAAMLVANFIRYRQEGYVPDRDLIIVLTADEETASNSIKWLVREQRALVDAEYALNTDAGGGELQDGKAVVFTVQTAEKMYLSFQLEVRNKGGHSSVPIADNAIYRLSDGLSRLAKYTFPVTLTETSRAFFENGAVAQPASVAADMRAVAKSGDAAAARRLSQIPLYNSTLRTTCVATRLFGGHADNALPQLARATVNCRLLPGYSPDSAEALLARVVTDTAIHISRVATPTASPASPLRADIMQPIEQLARKMWPGVTIVPEMSTGATDGLYVRNAGIPVYGVSAVFERVDDIRAHGRDERIGVTAYHDAAQFWYEIVKTLGSARTGA
jgi:acetylornithine deacetylase/succinyl-diaminopimelate desuccinylase-like protein